MLITAARLEALVRDIFVHAGCAADEAGRAHHGFGQTAGPIAVRLGIAKAAEHGVAAAALRHSGHLGRIGEWTEQAAKAGFVSIHSVNVAGSLLVAAFGAVERRFSTAPFAAGVPVPGRPPEVWDALRHADQAGSAR